MRHKIDTPIETLKAMEAQIALEQACNEAGVKRYWDARRRGMADAGPGATILHDILDTLIPAIRTSQLEAHVALADAGKGRQPSWWWIIQYLPADMLAYITIRTLMQGRPYDDKEGFSQSSACLKVGNQVKLEMEFAAWRVREANHAADNATFDLAKVMIARQGVVTEREWVRWRKKLKGRVERFKWTQPERLQLGGMLVKLAIEYGQAWFAERVFFL